MKGNFLKSTGRAAVMAASLLAVFLPAGASAQGNGQVPLQAAEHERDHPMWLRIMAFTDAPVVGADVRVSVHGRLLVEAKAATNRQGVFPARIWPPWFLDEEAAGDAKAPEPDRRRRRSLVRISISGGTINGDRFLGHLSADIAVTDPEHQILVVNPVTTLVSRLLDERPELKLDGAESVVRRFLKLPENYSLGLALGKSSHYVSPFFNPVTFMTEARDAGGLDAFEHLLIQELLQDLGSGSHPFRPPQRVTNSGTSDAAQPLGSTGSSNAISVIQAGLYAGLLDVANSEGVENLAGWALSYTGLATPGATKSDILALQNELQGITQQIDNLSSQVAQLTLLVQATATQTLYNTITTTAQTLANDVNDEENRLMYLAQDCPPLADGSTPPPLDPKSFCATEPQAIQVALSNEPIYSAYTNVQGYVQDSGTLGTEGMLHLYSLWLGQTERFFSSADSAQMQNLYSYWDGVLTQAADLKVEFLHAAGEQNVGAAQLIALMGNPEATPPTTGTFQFNETQNQKLMFPAVSGQMTINTKDRTFWSLSFPQVSHYGGTCGWIPQGPYGFAFTPYPLSYQNYGSPFGLRSPSATEMQSVIAGWTGSSPLDWLIANGFTGLAGTNGCGYGEVFWTESLTGQSYQLMNLATGSSAGSQPPYDTNCYPFGPGQCNDPNMGHFHWDMGMRSLAAGEQYYWYQ
jgi:hypothetical protein